MSNLQSNDYWDRYALTCTNMYVLAGFFFVNFMMLTHSDIRKVCFMKIDITNNYGNLRPALDGLDAEVNARIAQIQNCFMSVTGWITYTNLLRVKLRNFLATLAFYVWCGWGHRGAAALLPGFRSKKQQDRAADRPRLRDLTHSLNIMICYLIHSNALMWLSGSCCNNFF